MKMLFPFLALLAFGLPAIQPALAAEDILLRTKNESAGVEVELFIPKESRPVRGLLVHAAHYQMKSSGRWASLCRELGFAHLAANINLKQNNRPKRLREGMLAALDQFAQETKLTELTQVPRVGVGMSAGGMCIPMLIEEPHKLLTNAVSCSWVTDSEKIGPERAAIPQMFVIGALPDGFKMLPAIDSFYVPSVKAGNPWALGLQHGCKHDWANSGTLFVPWIRGIAKLRLPDAIPPGDPVPLKPVDFKSGWKGDRTTIDGRFASITPAADFHGKPEDVVWLPDRATAYVWRAWQTKDSLIHLTAQTADGSVKLPKFKPTDSFGISVPHGVDVVLGTELTTGGSVIGKVRFFSEDTLLGEANGEGIFVWKAPGKRAYAIWAEYEVDGVKAATNPALICVEDAARAEIKP